MLVDQTWLIKCVCLKKDVGYLLVCTGWECIGLRVQFVGDGCLVDKPTVLINGNACGNFMTSCSV